jgi:peptidoglycan/xylan/chitin deacetylase (PgdA/CDA1 family)
MRDAFDVLYREGATSPKLLSIGLHDRLIGRPARIGGLIRFLEHIRTHEGVWICRGIDIARHWLATFPPDEA